MVADDAQAFVFSPSIDALETAVDEVERPMRNRSCRRRAPRSRRLSFLRGTPRLTGAFGAGPALGVLGVPGARTVCAVLRRSRSRKLALAHEPSASDVFDCVLVRIFAPAQKRRTVVAIARREAALRIHVNIAKAHVPHAMQSHCRRRRAGGSCDAVAVIVRDQDVVRVADFERDGVATFAILFFGLRRRAVPSSPLGSARSRCAHGVLPTSDTRDRACPYPRRTARACVGVGAPDAVERAAAPARHPETRVLPVPASSGIHIAVLGCAV